mmetsp:Transcript_89544/g.200348  ORF Transcript_89544/g.200348 Transcript_89544/m.200348 type:complete len:201 (-) Transcript_89544:26-628(-)
MALDEAVAGIRFSRRGAEPAPARLLVDRLPALVQVLLHQAMLHQIVHILFSRRHAPRAQVRVPIVGGDLEGPLDHLQRIEVVMAVEGFLAHPRASVAVVRRGLRGRQTSQLLHHIVKRRELASQLLHHLFQLRDLRQLDALRELLRLGGQRMQESRAALKKAHLCGGGSVRLDQHRRVLQGIRQAQAHGAANDEEAGHGD